MPLVSSISSSFVYSAPSIHNYRGSAWITNTIADSPREVGDAKEIAIRAHDNDCRKQEGSDVAKFGTQSRACLVGL